MQQQAGARWLAHETHELGLWAEDAATIPDDFRKTRQGDAPPPGFPLFDCISDAKYASSMAALVELGFKVRWSNGSTL